MDIHNWVVYGSFTVQCIRFGSELLNNFKAVGGAIFLVSFICLIRSALIRIKKYIDAIPLECIPLPRKRTLELLNNLLIALSDDLANFHNVVTAGIISE
jgi:hypothetical protein